MNNKLRERMFNEMEQKFVFDEASKAAYAYADQMQERNVFPTNEAMDDLCQFDEELPESAASVAV